MRSPDEVEKGHIPDAVHIFLPELTTKLKVLKKRTPIAVYCASGYRASLATNILKPFGYDVMNVPGSWDAWKAAQYPIEGEKVSATS